MRTAVIGYPRVGKDRELKFASEKYFKNEIDEKELKDTAKRLRRENLELQKASGIDFISVNDFSFYDNMLDVAVLFNIIPEISLTEQQSASNTLTSITLQVSG